MGANQRINRDFIRSIARGLRVCQDNEEVGFWFAGRWFDLDKEKAEKIMNNGVELIIKKLGKSKAISEFQRYNVIIENNAETTD